MYGKLGTAVQLYVTGSGGSGVMEQFSCTDPALNGTGDWGELLTTTRYDVAAAGQRTTSSRLQYSRGTTSISSLRQCSYPSQSAVENAHLQ